MADRPDRGVLRSASGRGVDSRPGRCLCTLRPALGWRPSRPSILPGLEPPQRLPGRARRTEATSSNPFAPDAMPKRSPRPCSRTGCSRLTRERYCTEHARDAIKLKDQRIDERRGSPSARGYDRAWQRARKIYLQQHPLCECDECKAGELRTTIAEVVDHRISIAERPDLRLEPSNLRAMAKRCHDRHTARTQGFAQTRRV